MVKSYPVLFVTKHWHVLQILSSYTRAMGRFSDVIWYDLSVAKAWGTKDTQVGFKLNDGDCRILVEFTKMRDVKSGAPAVEI